MVAITNSQSSCHLNCCCDYFLLSLQVPFKMSLISPAVCLLSKILCLLSENINCFIVLWWLKRIRNICHTIGCLSYFTPSEAEPWVAVTLCWLSICFSSGLVSAPLLSFWLNVLCWNLSRSVEAYITPWCFL